MEGMARGVDVVDGQLDPHRLRTCPRNKLVAVPALVIQGDQRQALRLPGSMVDDTVGDHA